MKSLANKLLVGLAGLAIASVPLAASAQDFHGHDRGSVQRNDNRGRAENRGNFQRGDSHYRVSYSRPVYQQPYVNGYFGYAPGGFQGYYSNGGWFHHRRWNGGVWIYF
jgi:hypothetical protein